jgi:hypothetical protein
MIPQRSQRSATAGSALIPILGLLAVGLVLLVAAGRLDSLSSEDIGALIVVAALTAITVPLAVVLGRLDEDRGLTTLLLAAFAAKMIGAYVRHTVLYDVYGGSGDAARYYDVGIQLADQFQQGNYVFGEISGTRFMEILSGFVYTVLPRSELAGFVFFAWLAFLGLILFSRAIRIAVPDADHRRHDLLLFFLPTLVFWPSSIGKEAWMVAVLGLASYGAARLFAHRPSGLIPLGLGLWGATTVRPHLALMVLAALAPAWLARPSGRNRLGLSPYFRAFGFAALILVLLVVVAQAETFFGVERLDSEGAQEVATITEEQTAQGGSEFANTRVRSPTDIPVAAVTILFRPFVWEANSAQGLVTAAEGLVLVALVAVSWRQLLALPRTMVRNPYVLYCFLFTLAFIVAYSSFNNFGLLVRQRAQMFPFFLVLLTPLVRSSEPSDDAGAEPAGPRWTVTPPRPPPLRRAVGPPFAATGPRTAPPGRGRDHNTPAGTPPGRG